MKIAVIGDACTDKYIYGSCDRLCPEGPVAVMKSKHEISAYGMSANVYNNLINMRNDIVHHYSNDKYQMEKIRFVDEKSNQLLLRVDINDTCNRIGIEQLEEIKNQKYSAIIVSDYCKGYLQDEDIIELGLSSTVSFLDSKRKLTRDMVGAFNLIKLNEYEYKVNKELADRHKKKFVVTLGSKGVMFLGKVYSPPKILQTYDVSGAGDTFLAAIVSELMYGQDMDNAIKFAQRCCNKVIQERGTCVYKGDDE